MGLRQSISIIILTAAASISTARGAHTVPPPPFVFPAPVMTPDPREIAARQIMQDINRAQDAISRACALRLRQFEASPEWQQAQADARQAQRDYDRARVEAASSLQASDSFKSAELEIWKLQESLDAAQRQIPSNHARVAEIAMQLLQKRASQSKIESDLVANNDRLRDARYRMIDTRAKLEALRRNFAETMSSDPQWRDAKRHLSEARSRMTAIRK